MTVACNPAIVFQMTVARNPAIALVLVLVGLLSDSKKYCVISLTIRKFGVGLIRKSSKPVKPSVVLVLVRVTPFFFSKQLTSLVLLLLLTGLLKRANYFVSSISSW